MSNIEEMRKRFAAEPLIDSQLPLPFTNGCTFTELTGHCGHCGHCGNEVAGNCLRGRISNSIKDVYTFDANGLCVDCMKLFPIHGRVKTDGNEMRIEYVTKQGNWASAQMVSTKRIRGALKLAFAKIKSFLLPN